MSFNILFSRVSDPFLVNLLCITELESNRVTSIVVDSITVSGFPRSLQKKHVDSITVSGFPRSLQEKQVFASPVQLLS